MKVTRDGVDRSTNYLPSELQAISIVLSAWDGDTGQGTIPVPDPAGNQEPYEGEQLLIEQSGVTLVDGFLGAVQSTRGATAGSTRRVHTMTLADDNAILFGHATPGWVRPAEAPADRWEAFVDAFLPGSIDVTWLLTTNESGIVLPKKTYRTDSLFEDLSADTIGPTGKTVYIEHRNFHWHLPTEGQTCSIAIHDTATPTSTSFRPLSANRSKDGINLRNKLFARNNAGVTVSVTDATSVTRHDGAGLKHEGYSEYGDETAAEMTRDLNVTLLERKAEQTTWTYEIGPLTIAQAIELIPGSQMTVTAAVHGLSGAVKRIARVTFAYRHGPDARHFAATVELGFPRRVKRKPTKSSSPADSSGGSGVSGGSGDCGCAPFENGCPLATFDDMNRTNGSAWGTTSSAHGAWSGSKTGDADPSHLSVLVDSMVPTHGLMKLTNPAGPCNASAEERIVGPGFWSTGDWKINTSVSVINTNLNTWDIRVGQGGVGWGRNIGGPGVPQLQVENNGTSNFIAMPTATFDGMGFIDIELRRQGSTLTAIVAGVQLSQSNFDPLGPDDDLVFSMSGLAASSGGTEAHFGPVDYADCAGVPRTGQVFTYGATGDGSSTVFNALFPYRAIRSVIVGGTDMTSDVTASDPATGEVTFGHAPPAGVEITLNLESA